MAKRKDLVAAGAPAKKQRPDPSPPQQQQVQQQKQAGVQAAAGHSKGFKNKEKVLVLGTRGITYRCGVD